MAVLSANAYVKSRGRVRFQRLVCAQAVTTFQGSVMVYSTAANGVIPGDGSGGGSGAEFAGIAQEYLASTDITAGTTTILVQIGGEALLACSGASAQASNGQAVYYDASAASDNSADLVTTAATGDTGAGQIVEYVDSTYSWVDLDKRSTPTVGP